MDPKKANEQIINTKMFCGNTAYNNKATGTPLIVEITSDFENSTPKNALAVTQ